MNMRSEPEFNHPAFEMPEELPGARCRNVDPDAWFPEMGGNTKPIKAICLLCVERLRCLSGAVRREEKFGIWGGYSAAQIQALYLSPMQGCEPPPARPVEIVTTERAPSRARRHLSARQFGVSISRAS
jgi:Transcription factor WhiB